MENHGRSLVAKSIWRLTAIISLQFVIGAVALARQMPPPPNVEGIKREAQERQYSEARLRRIGADADIAKLDEQRIRSGIKQTKEDFKRIQLIRNDMVDSLLARTPLDYRLITDQAHEVNNRAERLRTFLLPPSANESNELHAAAGELTHDEMTGALVRLCNLIYSFTTNPTLKKLGTTDVKQSSKAGTELLTIIELSKDIEKSAERLRKSPK